MNTMISRLLHLQSGFPKPKIFCSLALSRDGRLFSTTSEEINGSSKVEEEDTVKSTSPAEKLLVLGGNGFVGSHVCKEALDRCLNVSSLSRSGRSSIPDSWANNVVWLQGDLLSPNSLKHAFNGVTSVISCVGGFGSHSHMYKINGSANINAVKAAAEEGVKRFVYISAADFGLINYLLRGYYDGKRSTEAELASTFKNTGVILRPGFIHGTRRVGSFKLPLSVIGAPLEMILRNAKPLTKIPLIGPLFIPPVSVTAVAKVAVTAATDPAFPPGILNVYNILQQSQLKSV